jgi:hypothetical protein
MATWDSNNVKITTKGVSLLSKVQLGICPLTITKVQAGSGFVAPENLATQTEVTAPKDLLVVMGKKVESNKSILTLQLSNTGVLTSYTLNQIGIFAQDPDDGEILYMIAQCNTDTGDVIPVGSTSPLVINFKFNVFHDEVDTIDVTVSNAGVVLSGDFNTLNDLVQSFVIENRLLNAGERTAWNNKAPNDLVTTSANGLMSSTDKTKLNGIAASANNYVHPTTEGNKHIPSGGSSGQILKYSALGTAAWANEYSYTHPTTAGNKHIPAGGGSNQILRYSSDGTAVWTPETIYIHPTTDGNKHVPANGTSNANNVLTASSVAGTYSWTRPTRIYYGTGNAGTGDSANAQVGDVYIKYE